MVSKGVSLKIYRGATGATHDDLPDKLIVWTTHTDSQPLGADHLGISTDLASPTLKGDSRAFIYSFPSSLVSKAVKPLCCKNFDGFSKVLSFTRLFCTNRAKHDHVHYYAVLSRSNAPLHDDVMTYLLRPP